MSSGAIDINPHQDSSNQLHNAFPYVFAFTVGQTVKNFAAWRLACGVTLGNLEQIMGSITVGGTIATHALLRPFNGLAIGLTILWASSPLGNYLLPNLGREIPEAVVSNITLNTWIRHTRRSSTTPISSSRFLRVASTPSTSLASLRLGRLRA